MPGPGTGPRAGGWETLLYLTTHNIHKIQTPKPPAGFEPAIAASERQQTHALDRAATGTGTVRISYTQMWIFGLQNKCEIFTCRSPLSPDGWRPLVTKTRRADAVCATGTPRVQVLRATPSLLQDSSGAHAPFEIQGVRRSSTYFQSHSRISEHSRAILYVCLVLKLPGPFVHILSTRDNSSSSRTFDF